MERRTFLKNSAAAAAGLLGGALARAAASKPNIVLIYADDLGYGDVACYGAKAVKTPNIDRLAAQGCRFTDVHAPSATCTPSRYALMTGQYAWRKKGTAVLPGDANLIIDPGTETLPSMLKSAGYRTGVVGKWHLGLGKGPVDWNRDIRPGPLEIGFDSAFIIPATGDRVPCVFVKDHKVMNLDPSDPIHVDYEKPFEGEKTGTKNPELLRLKPSHGHADAIVNGVSRIGFMTGGQSALWSDEEISTALCKEATAFIEKEKGQPFFLYFATHDIHVPRLPNKRFKGATTMGTRGDAIAEFDWSVGQILDVLDKNGLTESTLILFGSDNGPVIDDGYQDEAAERLGSHKPAGTLRGGKYSNYDGGTETPFIARWPGHIKAGATSNALLSHVDLLSTLAALTGQTLQANAGPDSLNLLPALFGKSEKGRENLVEHAGELSIIEGPWKLIRPNNKPAYNKNTNTELGNAPEPQLYDRRIDRGEKNNVASQNPQKVRELMALLHRIESAQRTRP